jgi:hypothetical protein
LHQCRADARGAGVGDHDKWSVVAGQLQAGLSLERGDESVEGVLVLIGPDEGDAFVGEPV